MYLLPDVSRAYSVQVRTEKAPSQKGAARCSCCQLLWMNRKKYASGEKSKSTTVKNHLKNEKDKVKTEGRYTSG